MYRMKKEHHAEFKLGQAFAPEKQKFVGSRTVSTRMTTNREMVLRITHRAHASVQYASKVRRGRVCSPDPPWMPFQPGRWLNCASDEGGGRGRRRWTALTASVEPGAPRRGAALCRMITRKTATDVQHHKICQILATTRCATATATAGAYSRNANDDDRIHRRMWAASLFKGLVDDPFTSSNAIDRERDSRTRWANWGRSSWGIWLCGLAAHWNGRFSIWVECGCIPGSFWKRSCLSLERAESWVSQIGGCSRSHAAPASVSTLKSCGSHHGFWSLRQLFQRKMGGAVHDPDLCWLIECRKWGNKLEALSQQGIYRGRPLVDAPRRLLRNASDTSEPIEGYQGGNNQCRISQPARIVQSACQNGGGSFATTLECMPYSWKPCVVAHSRTSWSGNFR